MPAYNAEKYLDKAIKDVIGIHAICLSFHFFNSI